MKSKKIREAARGQQCQDELMIGKRFGMLVVIKKLESSNGIKWLCQCDCGNTKEARTGHLNAGSPSSCGCDKYHGHGSNHNRSREYVSYHNMISRCTKPTNKRYADYGGSGITVCDSWLNSFQDFISDMGSCPDGYQIDRTDNTKGYSPENCKWVTRKENMKNRSVSTIFVIEGERFYSASEAAKFFGVSGGTVNSWCKGRVAIGRKNKNGVRLKSEYPPREGCYVEKVY